MNDRLRIRPLLATGFALLALAGALTTVPAGTALAKTDAQATQAQNERLAQLAWGHEPKLAVVTSALGPVGTHRWGYPQMIVSLEWMTGPRTTASLTNKAVNPTAAGSSQPIVAGMKVLMYIYDRTQPPTYNFTSDGVFLASINSVGETPWLKYEAAAAPVGVGAILSTTIRMWLDTWWFYFLVLGYVLLAELATRFVLIQATQDHQARRPA